MLLSTVSLSTVWLCGVGLRIRGRASRTVAPQGTPSVGSARGFCQRKYAERFAEEALHCASVGGGRPAAVAVPAPASGRTARCCCPACSAARDCNWWARNPSRALGHASGASRWKVQRWPIGNGHGALWGPLDVPQSSVSFTARSGGAVLTMTGGRRRAYRTSIWLSWLRCSKASTRLCSRPSSSSTLNSQRW